MLVLSLAVVSYPEPAAPESSAVPAYNQSPTTTQTCDTAATAAPTRFLPPLLPTTGNSGGPALSQREDVVVGVAFQNVPNADNIGYIIPLPVVQRFMRCEWLFGFVCACDVVCAAFVS